MGSEMCIRDRSLETHCLTKPVIAQKDDEPDTNPVESIVATDTHNWREAYGAWRASTWDVVTNNGVVPNTKQAMVLNLVHDRCVKEHHHAEANEEEPLLRLIHGLPGSGKSLLLKWLRKYFVNVWLWTEGREFIFIAPLNSMACNIGGATVHSWAAVSFKDKRGVLIRPQDQTYSIEIPAMSTKCGSLRFLFIDEFEATGADTIGEVEHNVTFHISSKNVFKYRKNGDVRPFGCLLYTSPSPRDS